MLVNFIFKFVLLNSILKFQVCRILFLNSDYLTFKLLNFVFKSRLLNNILNIRVNVLSEAVEYFFNILNNNVNALSEAVEFCLTNV